MEIRELKIEGYERVTACVDGVYRGFIAVHSTRLGPAVGGTRFWKYENDEAAVNDLLRLARGMTYKNALAKLVFSLNVDPPPILDGLNHPLKKDWPATHVNSELFGSRALGTSTNTISRPALALFHLVC